MKIANTTIHSPKIIVSDGIVGPLCQRNGSLFLCVLMGNLVGYVDAVSRFAGMNVCRACVHESRIRGSAL